MYFNTLIIMNEDALGYGNRSRKPSGYCKLTMPNRVSCYVQGLRQLPKGQIYRLYLTSKSKQESVEVGMLQVGSNGNKETRWVMNPASINNSGVQAEEVDGAFIMVSGEDIKGTVVPLVGFSSESYIWEHLVKNKEEIPPKKAVIKTEVKVATPVEIKPVDLVAEVTQPIEKINKTLEATGVGVGLEFANMRKELAPIFLEEDSNEDQVWVNEVLALKEEVKKLSRTIEESKSIIQALQNGVTETEEAAETEEVARTEEMTRAEESIKTESPNSKPTYVEPLEDVSDINNYINNFIRRFQTDTKEKSKVPPRDRSTEIGKIYEKRIPINPFEAQNTGIKWVRITHEDLTGFQSLNREWTNQALMMDANRDYKHFILGRDESGLTYYLGIPGVYDPHKESALNIDKIERFSCCHNVPPRAGEAGYWIAMI